MKELIKNPEDMYPNLSLMRWDIINKLIEKNNYTSYLEIGVQDGLCFDKIKCEDKTGVDPDNKATFVMTSDKFFSFAKPGGGTGRTFDIIFIDGLHEERQVMKDILNSLACLNDGGTILCHDMSPTSEKMQRVPRETKVWCGNGYLTWLKLRQERKDLLMYVIDTDFGVGVIQKGEQKLLKTKLEINYKNLSENKDAWLPLVSVEKFLYSHK